MTTLKRRTLGVWGVVTALMLVTGTVQTAVGQTEQPAWMMPELLAAAQAEGSLIVYTSVNENEGLGLFEIFEEATGIDVEYVRAADAQLMARMVLEFRANQPGYDIGIHSSASKLPTEMLAQFDPPLASEIDERARDADRRWYGVYQIFMAPAFNSELVDASKLPTSYEEFAQRTEWRGRVAIDGTSNEWVAAMFEFYGEDRARELLDQLAENLDPILTDGRLAMARSLGSGEYMVALDNFVNLVMNVQLSGGPVDVFPLDPLGLTFGQVSINSKASHSNAALLAANFMLSQQAQEYLATFGRIPTRSDVAINPPGLMDRLLARKAVVVLNSPEEEEKWQAIFDSIFRDR